MRPQGGAGPAGRGRRAGRLLADGGDPAQHLLAHRRTGRRGDGEAQAGGGGVEFGGLPGARLAVGEVPFEGRAFVVREGVQGVGPGQQVRVGGGHAVTPRQSRSRMRPSRSRVFTVPSGSVSASATWR